MRLPGVTYDSERAFSFSQRVQLALFPPLIALAIRLLYGTCRIEARGEEYLEEALRPTGHTLVALWHESMVSACWAKRGHNYHTLTSHSFDGEMAARIVRRFGLEAVRGSSSRGGSGGLRALEAAARVVALVGFTLDGPRGPRRIAKPGIGILAARTQLSVVPFALVPVSAVRLSSWDRLPLPRPFSRIIAAFGPPIPPVAAPDAESVEQMRLSVEDALNKLHRRIEAECGLDRG